MSIMAKVSKLFSPQVAKQLQDMARNMCRELYGDEGAPQWGTKFSEIEADGITIGNELARLMIQMSVEVQAQAVPSPFLQQPDETAVVIGSGLETNIQTPVGEVHWKQPKTRLSNARRDFFPSGDGIGS
jgi:hypothetical protein